MGRCDYDVIFYRVFCLALLGIGFIFTVILTNVFVDIDGLLSRNDKGKTQIIPTTEKLFIHPTPDDPKSDIMYKEDNYEDEDDKYRFKRSLETPNFFFHIKSEIMKDILMNNLENLLQKVDTAESTNFGSEESKNSKEITYKSKGYNRVSDETLDQSVIKNKNLKEVVKEDINDNNKIPEDKGRLDTKNEDLLHLAVQNIFVQGIVDHMKLKDVYKKMNNVFMKIDDYNKGRKALIKTVIDVNQNGVKNHTSPKEVKDILKLIYNGKLATIYKGYNEEAISFKTDINESDPRISTGTYQNYRKSITKTYKTNTLESLEDKPYGKKMSKLFVTKVVKDYLKKYNVNNTPSIFNSKNVETKRKFTTKRIKRQIKIKYNLEPTNQTKENNTTKNNDDELYVEIETHFDGKGMKGEKKKKLIKQVIDKIRKAIHSQNPETNKTKILKHVQVKKRVQNPLDVKHKSILMHEEAAPLETVIHRNTEPIEQFVARKDGAHIRHKFGENWKYPHRGPTSLTPAKTLGSAQLGDVDIDYDKFMNFNAVPKRVQIPLNTETSEEMFNSHYFNKGNVNLIIKDIDGSGFSVGFNQYTDAAPDPEAIKLFTGVENLVKAYHRNYDQATSREIDKQNHIVNVLGNNYEYMDNSAERVNRPDEHTIIRRSVKEKNFHANELKLDFQHLHTHKHKKKTIVTINNDQANNIVSKHQPKYMKGSNEEPLIKILPFIVNDDIFDQVVKPEEMHSLASLFDRKKRTIAVKKYSNLMSKKIKVNRFLNTKKMGSKRVLINKKRNKRNLGRLEVIASDDTQKRKQSEEHIFVLSDEGILADRATIREIETPEDLGLIDQMDNKEPHYDFTPVNSRADLPFAFIPPENPLMSKYPHIFMEEDSHRYDDLIPEVFGKLRTIPHLSGLNTNQDEAHATVNGFLPIIATTENYINTAETNPRIQEIVSAISPNSPKTKYKFTVKIIPNKNMTGLNGGFKEIHTSINKSFNRDGLMYSTLVNMSEISKIEDLLKLRETTQSITAMPIHIQRERQKIQSIIKNHKDRVDQQLNQLQKEKAHLETMMAKNDADSNDYVDITLPSNPLRKLHLKASDINKLAASLLMTLHEQKDIPTPLTTTDTTTSVKTTTAVTTPSTTSQTTISPERIRIIKTMEKNDNLTKEILNKIDKNTEMLQTFLVKLSDSIAKLRQQENRTEINRPTILSNNRNDWPIYQPEQILAKPRDINTTNYRIPFLYAYQQPYGLLNKPDSPMASIIYKGHIHTNTIDRPSETIENNNDNKMKANNNLIDRGRFFIDGIETGYRGIPRNNSLNNEDFVKVNNTVQRLV